MTDSNLECILDFWINVRVDFNSNLAKFSITGFTLVIWFSFIPTFKAKTYKKEIQNGNH